jgi:hypothetical protein
VDKDTKTVEKPMQNRENSFFVEDNNKKPLRVVR